MSWVRRVSWFMLLFIVLATDTGRAEVTFLNSISSFFNEPSGVAFGPESNIYVADLSRNRIVKMTEDGNLVRTWTTTNPRDVTVDAAGTVYVLDVGAPRVRVYNDVGTLQMNFGASGAGPSQFASPLGLATYISGELFVADSLNHRIQRFTVELSPPFPSDLAIYRGEFGTQGANPAEFEQPTGVDIDADGVIYVSDRNNDRIQVFDLYGRPLELFGDTGSGVGQLSNPSGIAVDENEHLYVVDRDNNRIQRFSTDGVFHTAFGQEGTGNIDFNDPRGIDVSTTGLIYVADRGNDRIKRYFDPEAWSRGKNEFTTLSAEPTSVGVGSIAQLGTNFGIHMGHQFELDTQKELVVGNIVRVAQDGTLSLTGGKLTTDQLTGDGRLRFLAGTMRLLENDLLIGAAGPVEDVVTVPRDSLIETLQNTIVADTRNGELNIYNGGEVVNIDGTIADAADVIGRVHIDGLGSTWTSTDMLTVANAGDGYLHVSDAAFVNSDKGIISALAGGEGVVAITGEESTWKIDTTFTMSAGAGDSWMTVEHAGMLHSATATLGSTGTAYVTVDGPRSTWANSGTVTLNRAVVDVRNGGRIEIGDDLNVLADSSIDIPHGTLAVTDLISNQGRLNLQDNIHSRISANLLENSGVMFGGGEITGRLENEVAGEMNLSAGDQLELVGTGHVNRGRINLQGGILGTTGTFENVSSGHVVGRGTIRADDGLTNRGRLTFSAQFTDIQADVTNTGSSALILSTGGGTTTFVGDVTNTGGAEVRVSTGSYVVFLGTYAGGTTGAGTAIIEGILAPGESPGIAAFGGNVQFGSGATSAMEVAGTTSGMFDQVIAEGDIALDGLLDVQPIDGYSDPSTRGDADTFPFYVAEGEVTGSFSEIRYAGAALTPTFVEPDSLRTHQGSGFFRNVDAQSGQLTFTNYVARVGDADGDRDVDGNDRSLLINGWTGANVTGATWIEGDTDQDGDTDSLDATLQLQLWTGDGNLEDNGQVVTAPLVYRSDTGNVTLQAPSPEATLISFVLQSETAALLTANANLPFQDDGSNTDSLTSQIGQTDPVLSGQGSSLDLGNILPPGIETEGELAAFISSTSFASDLGIGGAFELNVVSQDTTDLNSDGAVDAADVGIMVANWGVSGEGDFNLDGIVDAADAGILVSFWTGDTSVSHAVPEPTSLALLLCGLVGGLRRVRRH